MRKNHSKNGNTSNRARTLRLSTQTLKQLDTGDLNAVLGGVYDRKQGATRLCDPTG